MSAVRLGSSVRSISNILRRFFLHATLCVVACGAATQVTAAPATATATALAVTSGGSSVTTVVSGSVVTLTATVTAGTTPVTIGQVNFCDATATSCTGTHLIGTAQLTSAGTSAFKFVPSSGSHSYKAVFVGTGNDAASSSSAPTLTVTPAAGKQSVTTTLAQSGSAGNLMLTATVAGSVTGSGSPSPTGTVSFVDTSNGSSVLGTAPLGSGSFGENWSVSQTPTVGLHPKTVLVGDVDGDGIPDIISGGDGVVSVLIGNGDGTFKTANNITALNSNPWIAMAPFRNGGPMDILAVSDSSNNANNAAIIFGNGTGGVLSVNPFSLPLAPVSAVATGDFNGDGQQDFVAVFPQANKISTFLGNGDGTFQAPTTLSTGSAPVSAVVGNFNGNGKIDIAVANSGDNTISIYLGSITGTETTNPFTVATPIPAFFSPTSITAADLNGDGVDDLLVTGTNSQGSVVAIFFGKGGGAFTVGTLIPQMQAAFGIVAADVLGNGKLDIVITTPTGNALGLFLNDGNGNFSQGVIPPLTGNSPMFLAAGHFNGQATMGLTVANNADGTVSVFLPQLTQSATASISGISGANPDSLRGIAGGPVTQTGGDNIVAQYPGDANFASSTSTPIVVAVSNPVPTVTTLSPTSVAAASGAFTLTVNGTNFISSSSVTFNGAVKTTTFINSTQLTAAIPATDVASAGTPSVTVTNPIPGGGQSNSVTFTITTATNPVPAVTSLSPTGVAAGSGTFTLTVNGTGFVSGALVNFGGTNKTTSFVNSTQVTATILATDIVTAGTPAVFVNNPNPGGASNSINFNITAAVNPVPTVTTLSPTTVSAGVPAFTMTVTGTNFVSTSVVDWNGAPQPTTFVSATQLTATISSADVQFAGSANVIVVNPVPGGGISNTFVFVITTPVAALTTLAPNSAIAGAAAFSLTVNGSNFLSNAVVQWNGGNRATTFVSSTQLKAAITAADIATAGTASVVVFNTNSAGQPNARTQGAPVGTFSNPLTFTITAASPVPTLTSISPATIGAGGAAFTLTLTGTNFVSSSVAQWKGSARATTFVSATQLTAAITAADIAASGTAVITVVNPTPGGTSNSLAFTIADFSVSATTPTQNVTAGGSANFTIATATVGGAFPGPVTFTATGLPTGASASFSPSSVSAGTSTAMTITTTARGSAQIITPPASPNIPTLPVMLIVMLLVLAASLAFTTPSRAKFDGHMVRQSLRRLIPIGAFALLLISVGYISSCSGGGFPKVGSNTGTPAGTFTVTITGTSGAIQHTTTVTLVVQ